MLLYKSRHNHPCPKWISEHTDSYLMTNLLHFHSCTWWFILYIISNSLWKLICVSSVLWIRRLFLSIPSQNYVRDLKNFWVSFKTHLHWNIWVKKTGKNNFKKSTVTRKLFEINPSDGLSGGIGQRGSILLMQNFALEWKKTSKCISKYGHTYGIWGSINPYWILILFVV